MSSVAVISVNVHDMDAAIGFYRDVLGVAVDSDAHAPHFVELKCDGPTLLLQLCERPASAAYPDGACVFLNLAVDDAAAELERLRARGADVVHAELQESPVGPYFAVRDPSGNVVELVEFQQ